jgi:hypothetical protein
VAAPEIDGFGGEVDSNARRERQHVRIARARAAM